LSYHHFRTAIDWPDDWLDDDGFPIPPSELWRFVHGDESDCGDGGFVQLVDVTGGAIERIYCIVRLSANTDSPIESQLGAAVSLFFEKAGLPLKIATMLDVENVPDALLLVPQFKWGYYRSDWAILNPKRGGAFLIECDGKDFHSSPEQLAHDAKKDAAALDRGYLTMRFTGSEIHRQPDVCAGKIFHAVCGL
jgi:very-short-patch-repair endonuclease